MSDQAAAGLPAPVRDLAGQRVLVTGGSGFIGTHLVEALAGRGALVTNLDVRAPQLDDQRSHWRRCDLLDRTSLGEEVTRARPSVVYNLAAETNIALGPERLQVNTVGLTNVVDACVQQHEKPHVIHVSTQLVMSPGHVPVDDVDFAPYSEYGASKAESERLLRARADLPRWTIVRPTNVWGPYHPTFADQIWKYIARGLYLHPTGTDPRRSYGYVDNVVHQLLRVAVVDDDVVTARTFYVGDEPLPSSVWLDAFGRALRGRPVRRVPGTLLRWVAEAGELSGRLGGPHPIDRGRLYRMTTDYAVPMRTTLALLGSGPIALEEGVRRTTEWLRTRDPRLDGR